jgi:hypothetical protein
MQTAHSKLAATEKSLKRWQTRLKRATNMVTKLDRQRRRYQVLINTEHLGIRSEPKRQTGIGHATIEQPIAEVPAVEIPTPVEPAIVDDIPAVLDRRDPEVKAKLEAAREAAKKQMPLNEREARDFIRKRSIAVERKREKRDAAFFKKA